MLKTLSVIAAVGVALAIGSAPPALAQSTAAAPATNMDKPAAMPAATSDEPAKSEKKKRAVRHHRVHRRTHRHRWVARPYYYYGGHGYRYEPYYYRPYYGPGPFWPFNPFWW